MITRTHTYTHTHRATPYALGGLVGKTEGGEQVVDKTRSSPIEIDTNGDNDDSGVINRPHERNENKIKRI